MVNIQIADSLSPEIKTGLLEEAARATLRLNGSTPEVELTILLTDDAQMQQLNSQFLGIDAPTDVLSFPTGDFPTSGYTNEDFPGEFIDPDTHKPYLGDIAISYPRAQVQASSAGNSLIDELRLLVVHGTLHLLGYDHTEPDEKTAMWALQSQILTQLG
jgi:probable rRNA maturation factor